MICSKVSGFVEYSYTYISSFELSVFSHLRCSSMSIVNSTLKYEDCCMLSMDYHIQWKTIGQCQCKARVDPWDQWVASQSVIRWSLGRMVYGNISDLALCRPIAVVVKVLAMWAAWRGCEFNPCSEIDLFLFFQIALLQLFLSSDTTPHSSTPLETTLEQSLLHKCAVTQKLASN